MKPGKQSDIVKEFGVSRNAVSLLVKNKDYRIIYTPGGKIDLDATIKALSDSGFGERSRKLKLNNGKSKTVKAETQKKSSESEEDIQDYITGKKQVTLASPSSIIHKYKELQQTRKIQAEADRLNELSVPIIDVQDTAFSFFRDIRDAFQMLPEKAAIKIRSTESDHEAITVLKDSIHQALESVMKGYDLDDPAVKKKLIDILI